MEKCYIIILNYNNTNDTIDCVRSIVNNCNKKEYRVIIVDNYSNDQNINDLYKWISTDFLIKDNYSIIDEININRQIDSLVNVIRLSENKGFSGGNNIGIKIATIQNDCRLIFILNNDTIIFDDLVGKMLAKQRMFPDVDLFSLKVRSYYDRNEIQFCNKIKLCKYISRTIKSNLNDSDREFYSGCGFFITNKFVDIIGLMNEDYFLYYEELDWIERIKKTNLKIKYFDDVSFLHKWNASTSKNSRFATYCYVRSSLIFTNLYHPYCLVFVICYHLLRGIYYLYKKNLNEANMIFLAIKYYFLYSKEKQIEAFWENEKK